MKHLDSRGKEEHISKNAKQREKEKYKEVKI